MSVSERQGRRDEGGTGEHNRGSECFSAWTGGVPWPDAGGIRGRWWKPVLVLPTTPSFHSYLMKRHPSYPYGQEGKLSQSAVYPGASECNP